MDELGSVDVVGEFGRRKEKFVRVVAGGFLLFLALFVSGIAIGSLLLVIAALGFVFVLGIYTNFVLYRCPSCGGWPGRGFWGFPRHCANCGAALE